jgi:ATP-dependent DNA ligase
MATAMWLLPKARRAGSCAATDHARRRRTGVYEIKHDGFRFISRREGDRVRVFSRRGHD